MRHIIQQFLYAFFIYFFPLKGYLFYENLLVDMRIWILTSCLSNLLQLLSKNET